MIFVDTSAWFASIVPSDTNYPSASSWVNQNTQPLLTTDYIVDETLTLLRSRGEAERAIRLGDLELEFLNQVQTILRRYLNL